MRIRDSISKLSHTKTWSGFCFTDQRQTSDAGLKSSTVTQGLKLHHFAKVFPDVYSTLSILFLELLNNLHINTVSLQQGCSEKIAIYIENYGEYDTHPFGII
jgi:hypothetical protein